MNKIEDDSVQKILDWADENSIPDLKWIEHDSYLKGGYYKGVPRDKEKLLDLTELNLLGYQLAELPKEIGTLTQLKKLYLSGNKLTELPAGISNLVNLEELYVPGNHLKVLPKEIGSLRKLY